MTFQNVATRSPQLGSKRVCVSCSTRFYDMTKAPPVCPKCGTVQPPEVPRVRAPVREPRRPFRTPMPVAAVEAEEEAAPLADPDADEDAEADADVEEIDEDDETPDIVRAPEHDL
jgi:uncharacterized protein (TIGR02300 family)